MEVKLHLSMEILLNAISPIAIIEVFCLNFHTIIDVLIASSNERTLETWLLLEIIVSPASVAASYVNEGEMALYKTKCFV
jgi:hypothetical protein